MRRLLLVLVACLLTLAAARPNDPLVERQYHLQTVGVFDAWDRGRGGGVIVAVLDTGVMSDHPDLDGRVLPGIDLVEPHTPAEDENGHGTLVAGVIAAVVGNEEGITGVAPHTSLLPVRVLDRDGNGEPEDVAEGIAWAVRHGARVINLSLAQAPDENAEVLDVLVTGEVEDAIRDADARGVTVVVAAGNEGAGRTPYSDDLPALVVGATDRSDEVWPHSNFDPRTLFAPGVDIVSTWNQGQLYGEADGTSFAAPIVSAGAALLHAQGLASAQIRERLFATAVPIGAGAGRLDLRAALALSPPPPPPPTPRQPPPASHSPPRAPPSPAGTAPPSPPPAPPADAASQPPPATPVPVQQPAVSPLPSPRVPVALELPSVAPVTPAPVRAVAADHAAPAPQRTPWVLVAAGLLVVDVGGLTGYLLRRRRF